MIIEDTKTRKNILRCKQLLIIVTKIAVTLMRINIKKAALSVLMLNSANKGIR